MSPTRARRRCCRPPDPRLVALIVGIVALVGSAWTVSAGVAPRTVPRTQGVGSLQPRTLTVDGVGRSYLLYVPSSYQPGAPMPLVLALHGLGGSGAQFARSTRFADEAERGGFLVALPDGQPLAQLAGLRGWDVAVGDARGDLRFLARLLDATAAEFDVDVARVYAVGHSNGGAMAYRLACDLSNRIAAIGVVAGFAVANCAPEQPVAVLHIHGTADVVVPFAGGAGVFGLRFPPVSAAIDGWRERNGCASEPIRSDEPSAAEPVTRVRYTDCAAGADVDLVAIDGAGHPWPGDPSAFARVEGGTLAVDATALIWQFLQAHPRRTP